jgi:hypothetical protein
MPNYRLTFSSVLESFQDVKWKSPSRPCTLTDSPALPSTPSLYEAFPAGVTGDGATADHSLVLIEAVHGAESPASDQPIAFSQRETIFGRRGKQ